jgi:hypothetical protein
MKKIYLILVVTLILSSCFNNSSDSIQTDPEQLDIVEKINNINTEMNLDEEIKQEEKRLKELEEINENEIDELINSIID